MLVLFETISGGSAMKNLSDFGIIVACRKERKRCDFSSEWDGHLATGPLDPVRTLQLAVAHFNTHRRQIDILRSEVDAVD
jgi:hypothetical protein